jgi:hypothetical protein
MEPARPVDCRWRAGGAFAAKYCWALSAAEWSMRKKEKEMVVVGKKEMKGAFGILYRRTPVTFFCK